MQGQLRLPFFLIAPCCPVPPPRAHYLPVSMLIRLDQVTKGFGGKSVLRDLTLQLNRGEKAGLVGRNGSGKTTLLRLINGELEPDSGQVTRHPQIRLGFLEQISRAEAGQTLLESALSVHAHLRSLADEIENLEAEIESRSQQSDLNSLLDRYGKLQTRWEMEGGFSYAARTKSVLFGLGFEDKDLVKECSLLSGGELNRLNLAKLLLSDPNLLLLDEPTNHLDISAVQWLETFLKDYRHAFLLISHDRCFLDATVEQILELSDGKIEQYPGNYLSYAIEREKRWRLRRKAYEEQQEMIERTEEFIRRNLAGQKTKQARSRQKMLDRLDRLETMGSIQPNARFRFEIGSRSGDLVIKFTNVAIGYRERPLASNLNLSVYRGNRVGVVGPNGSGKSALLKTILSQLEPLGGDIQVGYKVQMGYYDQQLSVLDPQLTVLEEMRSVAPMATDEVLRAYLARFLFHGEEVFVLTSSLSGGEKSRLALAKLIFGKSNTLVLDEPTNHLDIFSREVLESALQEFPGTLIMVSHDRFFLNRLTDLTVFLEGNGQCTVFNGPYGDFERFRAEAADVSAAVNSPSGRSHSAGPTPVGSGKPKLSKNELSKLRDNCKILEQEIQRIEELIELSAHQLNEPSLAKDLIRFKQLSDHHQDLNAQLDRLYAAWEDSIKLLELG